MDHVDNGYRNGGGGPVGARNCTVAARQGVKRAWWNEWRRLKTLVQTCLALSRARHEIEQRGAEYGRRSRLSRAANARSPQDGR